LLIGRHPHVNYSPFSHDSIHCQPTIWLIKPIFAALI
jgi:hypothetical protein